jgi:hypothetical protein
LDTALLNSATSTVNFPVADGGSFYVFGSDWNNSLFSTGTAFTLIATFADGTSATASATVGSVFDYTLTNTGNITVAPGNSGNTTITATLATGTAQAVTLAATGLPTGASASFTNNPCSPTCSSTLTISTTAATAPGTYPITVTGTPLNHTTTFNLVVNTAAPTLTLSFSGKLRDKVGPGDVALSPDNAMDGTFLVTLQAGSGNRTVTNLDLRRVPAGEWDTVPGGVGNWALGAATGLDTALLNSATSTVNFPVADGGSFYVFGSDWGGGLFTPGITLTLIATFTDGTTATASATIR